MRQEGLDDTDRAILRELSRDADISRRTLGERIGLLQASLSKKISQLREKGFIRRFTIDINFEKSGFPVAAIFLVRATTDAKEFEDRILQIHNVVEVNKLIGHHDYLIKAHFESSRELMDISQDIMILEGVKDVQTLISAKSLLNDSSRPFKKEPQN